MEPLVSVIIPTRNRPNLVNQAVNSVFWQTHKRFEIIVIDDSDDDSTKALFREKDSFLRYFKNSQKRGAPFSRNIGLREAKGEFVAFLDDDDIWLPQKVEKQLKYLDRWPLVSCNYKTKIGKKIHYYKSPQIVTFEDLLSMNFLGSCSFVVVRADVVKGCFFDESLKSGQDWDMWLSIMKRGKIRESFIVEDYLVKYNSGEYEKITSLNKRFVAPVKILNKYLSDYDEIAIQRIFLNNFLEGPKNKKIFLFRELLKFLTTNKAIFLLPKVVIQRLFRIHEAI